MTIKRTARETITAVELNHDDTLEFTLANGEVRRIRLVGTRATIDSTSLPYPLARAGDRPDLVPPEPLPVDYAARIVLRMHCTLEIDDHDRVELVRWVGNQRSFSPPWELAGVRIWFDAADALFGYLGETHGPCRPRKAARFAIQDASMRICPPLLHPWCPLPAGTLRIEDCYAGSDCWMGPYAGSDAHGGLDINHSAGTQIWAPFSLDEQELFASLSQGDSNNRWHGRRRWADGSTWIIGVHHVIGVQPPPGSAVESGSLIARGAGVAVGAYEHSHFTFGVVEPGDSEEQIVLLDPWILFRQMYEDRLLTQA